MIRLTSLLVFITYCLLFASDTFCSNLKQCGIKKIGYTEIIPEPDFKNLKMIGLVNNFGVNHENKNYKLKGAILRTLRFKNVTDKIEKKYGLKKNVLLSMILQESNGVDLLTNGSNDGGAGLCHMQPVIARQFGLKVFQNCNRLVSKKHGRALVKLIEKYNYDRKKLIKYDV